MSCHFFNSALSSPLRIVSLCNLAICEKVDFFQKIIHESIFVCVCVFFKYLQFLPSLGREPQAPRRWPQPFLDVDIARLLQPFFVLFCRWITRTLEVKSKLSLQSKVWNQCCNVDWLSRATCPSGWSVRMKLIAWTGISEKHVLSAESFEWIWLFNRNDCNRSMKWTRLTLGVRCVFWHADFFMATKGFQYRCRHFVCMTKPLPNGRWPPIQPNASMLRSLKSLGRKKYHGK